MGRLMGYPGKRQKQRSMAGSKYQLILSPEASDEVVELFDFYESQKSGWGDFFMDQLADCLNRITSLPFQWQYALKKEDQIRRALITTPPVVILYLIEEADIRILSVKDTRSDWRPS